MENLVSDALEAKSPSRTFLRGHLNLLNAIISEESVEQNPGSLRLYLKTSKRIIQGIYLRKSSEKSSHNESVFREYG